MQPAAADEQNLVIGNGGITTTSRANNIMASSSSPFGSSNTTFDFQHSFCNNNSFSYPSSFYPHHHHHQLVSDVAEDATPEARALAALKNHKEAEKRRRERINSHLDRLRTLLPCASKIDKASLLAKVVERVRDLKEQTSEILQLEAFPSETDEISVLSSSNDNGRLLIKASLCCEDRSDLIPDLIESLKTLHLSPLRAEMVTIGGRIRNVIILAGDKDHHQSTDDESLVFLRDALKSLIQRSSYGSGERSKRRRVIDHHHHHQQSTISQDD